MRRGAALLLGSLLVCAASGAVTVAPVVVGRFSSADLSGWQAKSFKGHTDYRIATVEGRTALEARSHATASGLYRELRVDLTRTPYLNWSWRVENTLDGVKETTRSGDDYPARIYVVVSGGLLFWRTRAVNYVWSSNQPVGSVWKNAFTSNATMVAVASGNDRLHRWVSFRRNVHEDLRRFLGEDIDHIDAIAVMTDTDNSGQSATAYYGDIRFTAE